MVCPLLSAIVLVTFFAISFGTKVQVRNVDCCVGVCERYRGRVNKTASGITCQRSVANRNSRIQFTVMNLIPMSSGASKRTNERSGASRAKQAEQSEQGKASSVKRAVRSEQSEAIRAKRAEKSELCEARKRLSSSQGAVRIEWCGSSSAEQANE